VTDPCVHLDAAELLQAAVGGALRRVSAIQMGRQPKNGAPTDNWTMDIEGAAAELAVAKYLGAYWKPITLNGDIKRMHARLDAADIGRRIQVRSTWRTDGHLIVKKDDPDYHVFFLAIGAAPDFRIAGWIMGCDSKRAEWWRAADPQRPPAYFVPQGALITC
jgi:hypothetical protein